MRNRYALLGVLTFINLFNYVDRYILVAVLPKIQKDMLIGDARAGLLAPAFIIIYALACPLFGWLGDRGPRKVWIAIGIGLWSVATGCAGLAQHFNMLLMARAFVGIGEAAYGTLAPAIIGDCFDKKESGFALSIFFAAIPVGSALGYLLGGVLGEAVGWRSAFFIVGFPGIILAALILWLREPEFQKTPTMPLLTGYHALWSNTLYRNVVLGSIFYTFSIGGLGFWLPTYMIRLRGFPPALAGIWSGTLLAGCGLLGTLSGGALIRVLQPMRRAYALVTVGGMLGGTALGTLALLAPSNTIFLVCLGLGSFCLFLNTGPINALILRSVPNAIRATAMALSVLCIHIFGDAISPALMGTVSEAFNLQWAMLLIVGFFALAAFWWSLACRHPIFSSQ
jgi:MFS transporter, Spinster family, sphingosine-1-phosphate transporter